MSQLSKAVSVGTISAETKFEDFEGLSLIDAGEDGFKLKDKNDNTCVIPTGIPVTIGGPGTKVSEEISVVAPDTGTLNVSYILYA
jgi:hypothetical protein